MLTHAIKNLFIYPIKSLRGIAVDSVNIDQFGLEHDRRWMLIDDNNKFVSQRQISELCLINVDLIEQGLRLQAKGMQECQVSISELSEHKIQVSVWHDVCSARLAPKQINATISHFLQASVSLVYMEQDEVRAVNPDYAIAENNKTSFTDGFPLLIIGQASLNDLNNRLAANGHSQIGIERFRPNIVVASQTAFAEDNWQVIEIGNVKISLVKPCSRCIIPTIDVETAQRSKEPLSTLKQYRQKNNKIYFGQNAIHHSTGVINSSDLVKIIQ